MSHITTIAVHPEYRRLHIGERLLVHDIIEAKKVGANCLTLEVRESNRAAQNLYGKYGFKSLGVRRHYYQDNNEDAFVLWSDNIHSVEFCSLIQERLLLLESLLNGGTPFKTVTLESEGGQRQGEPRDSKGVQTAPPAFSNSSDES